MHSGAASDKRRQRGDEYYVEVINGSGYRCRVAAIDREPVGVCSART